MEKNRILRASVGAFTIAGLALSAFVVACGDDESTPPPGTDSGTDANASDTGAGIDSGGADGGGETGGPADGGGDADADALAPVIPAKIQLVNAATDLGPNDPVGAVRICYKIGKTAGNLVWASLPPLPNRKASPAQPFPGVPIGTGGPVDSTGADLANLVIRPYVLSALALENAGLGSDVAAGKDTLCGDIIDAAAGGPFVKDKDYWILPDIPPGTFAQRDSYLLALTGCTGDSTKDGRLCGVDPSGTPGNGNLAIDVFKIDNTTAVSDAELGVQFVLLSPSIGPALQAPSVNLPVRPAISTNPGNEASAKLFASAPGDVTLKTLTPLAKLTGVNPTDSAVIHPEFTLASNTLSQIAAFSFGVADGGVYANGKTFTFIALGEASLGAPAGKEAHFLALPNDPTIEEFDPAK